jgi:hypothetical protein
MVICFDAVNNVKLPGSNLNPETGYPDEVFVVFLSPSRQMLDSTLN